LVTLVAWLLALLRAATLLQVTAFFFGSSLLFFPFLDKAHSVRAFALVASSDLWAACPERARIEKLCLNHSQVSQPKNLQSPVAPKAIACWIFSGRA
jgi:hypothetical protein